MGARDSFDTALRAPAACAAVLLLLAAGCSTTPDPQWVPKRFADISYQSVYTVVLATLDDAGYPVRDRDPDAGRIETDWSYGTSLGVVRGPSRRRVLAEIDPTGAPGEYLVRLRVAEEVVRKAGLLAPNVRRLPETAWERWDDNPEEAELLMARIQSVLRLAGARVERAAGDTGLGEDDASR